MGKGEMGESKDASRAVKHDFVASQVMAYPQNICHCDRDHPGQPHPPQPPTLRLEVEVVDDPVIARYMTGEEEGCVVVHVTSDGKPLLGTAFFHAADLRAMLALLEGK